MLEFVNAKVNIGLCVTGKRADGYHDLETVFYPIGLYAGSAENPVSFGDLLEVTPAGMGTGLSLTVTGRRVDCPTEQNLVWRAARVYLAQRPDLVADLQITLEKHTPDQAGLGGGSADAAFTLQALAALERDFTGLGPGKSELAAMALGLGADCPFFLLNRPAFASGVGEKLKPVDLDLSGYWMLVVKPPVSVSTRDAFAGITPAKPAFDLRRLASLPVEEWCGLVTNDFEKNVFLKHPVLAQIKNALYDSGALYASMSGSGSALYGIFPTQEAGEKAQSLMKEGVTAISATNLQYYLLKL